MRPCRRRPRALPRARIARILGVGALALVVLILAFIAVRRRRRRRPTSSSSTKPASWSRATRSRSAACRSAASRTSCSRKDFKAQITIHVDSSLTPLHQGTVAQVRVPSLSSVANRYILLTPGPNSSPALAAGATLPASATREVGRTSTSCSTRSTRRRARGLAQFIQGSAEQYAGAGRALGASIEYFPPFLSATSHFFARARARPAHVHELPG